MISPECHIVSANSIRLRVKWHRHCAHVAAVSTQRGVLLMMMMMIVVDGDGGG